MRWIPYGPHGGSPVRQDRSITIEDIWTIEEWMTPSRVRKFYRKITALRDDARTVKNGDFCDSENDAIDAIVV